MSGAITDVAGIEVGHAQDFEALTGCTVVLCREGATVGVDVRGLAPGTRETDLCRPGTLVEQAHAVLLAGGSAFGLNAAGGVMRYLWEQDRGFDTGVTRVPIVPGAVIFDLGVGRLAWPDESMGYLACQTATASAVEEGCVGAGTGASVGKALGPARATKAGLGSASVRVGRFTVGALMVVNALGDVVLPDSGAIIAGARHPENDAFVDSRTVLERGSSEAGTLTNTTIGVVATDAGLPADWVSALAAVSHDGLARTIRPAHTLYDGDTIFALATGRGGSAARDLILPLSVAAVAAVESAVVRAIQQARPAGGLPAGRW